MNTATTEAPAIGTCLWNGHTVRADCKPAQQLTPCPICEPVEVGGQVQRSMVRWTKVSAKVNDAHECDGACRSAKSPKCSCECGGRNHGIAYEVR